MTLPEGFGETIERLRRSTVMITGEGDGTGSGVIVDPGGAIATNAHVVRSARPRVQLWDGRVLPATLRAHDRTQDLALLAVSAGELPPPPILAARAPEPGELVIAAGNPLGFIGAVTLGTVRGIGTLRGFGRTEWLQSDVRLAPGNSGGPLADAQGAVLGLNTMIAGRLSLAIPAGALRRFIDVAGSRSMLGLTVHAVSVAVEGLARAGLLVLEIGEGSPAETASLLPGDIIIGVDGAPMEQVDLAAAAGKPGSVLRVQFLRGDRSRVRTASVLLRNPRSRAA